MLGFLYLPCFSSRDYVETKMRKEQCKPFGIAGKQSGTQTKPREETFFSYGPHSVQERKAACVDSFLLTKTYISM